MNTVEESPFARHGFEEYCRREGIHIWAKAADLAKLEYHWFRGMELPGRFVATEPGGEVHFLEPTANAPTFIVTPDVGCTCPDSVDNAPGRLCRHIMALWSQQATRRPLTNQMWGPRIYAMQTPHPHPQPENE